MNGNDGVLPIWFGVDPVAAGFKELGRRLRACRDLAGLTQHDLGELVCFSRSKIANVEVGRQNMNRQFWQRTDDALDAGGSLLAAFDEASRLAVEAARRRAHPYLYVHEPSEQSRAPATLSGAVSEAPMVYVTVSAGASVMIGSASPTGAPVQVVLSFASQSEMAEAGGEARVYSLAARRVQPS